MKKIFTTTALAMTLMLSGCATPQTPPTAAQIKAAKFPDLPTDYKQQIMGLIGQQLKDPDSGKYKFAEPRKVYLQDAVAAGSKVYYGWMFNVSVNAKNSYGGYTGYKNDAYAYIYNDKQQKGGYLSQFTMKRSWITYRYVAD